MVATLPTGLTDEELALCRTAFNNFDKDGEVNAKLDRRDAAARQHDPKETRAAAAPCEMLGPGSGTIDVKELKAALNSMGQNPTDEELFVIIHDVRHWAVAC